MANSVIYNQLFGTGSQKGGAKKTVMGLKNLYELMNIKKVFLLQVFANLIVQLGITYFVMQRTKNVKTNKFILWFASFAALLVIILVPMHPILKFVVFSGFSAITGLLLSSIKTAYSPQAINMAIMGALSVFGAMIALGVALLAGGFKLGYKFGTFLFFALLALIIFRVIAMFGTGMSQNHKVFSIIGIINIILNLIYWFI